jgi:uncharacterized protein YlzI (FlbEa/FlbD family)
MIEIIFTLVILHTLDGREVYINADEVTSINCKIQGSVNKLFVEGVNAILSMTDGKTVSVKETCEEIRTRMKGENL